MSAAINQRDKEDVFLHMRLRKEIAVVSDGYYSKGEELARQMENEKIKPTQVRGLENMAYSTDKVSDIFDLVKKQTGKGRWSPDMGESLLDELNNCRADARRIAQTVDQKDDDLPRRVHLLLCRELIKHLAAHFMFLPKENEENK